jgi:hypothetical protein
MSTANECRKFAEVFAGSAKTEEDSKQGTAVLVPQPPLRT